MEEQGRGEENRRGNEAAAAICFSAIVALIIVLAAWRLFGC